MKNVKWLKSFLIIMLTLVIALSLYACQPKTFASGTYFLTNIEPKLDNANSTLSFINETKPFVSFITFGTCKEVWGQEYMWKNLSKKEQNAQAIGFKNYIGIDERYNCLAFPGADGISDVSMSETYYIKNGKIIFKNKDNELYLFDSRAEAFIDGDIITLNVYCGGFEADLLLYIATYTKTLDDTVGIVSYAN